ncbi:MAG: glucosaminidase domain-containing protein [Bacteroidota bacterium]
MKGKQQQSLQREVEDTILDHLTLPLLLKQLWQSAKRLWMSLSFVWHRLTFGVFSQFKLSLFRVTVIALIVFIFFKKDLQVQVRMNSPEVSEQVIPMTYTENSDRLSVMPNVLSFLGSDKNEEKAATVVPQINQPTIEAYIKRFAKVAVQEQEKFGIPASIKMAQAILESEAGTNDAAQTHNHFGQPLANQLTSSAWESWRAHSLLFSSEQYPYQQLLQHGKDYKKWAKGLAKLNYSTIPNYDQALIQLIEQYEIYRLDEIKL